MRSRDRLKKIKSRVKYIIDGETDQIPLNDTYILSTWDYSVDDLTAPMSSIKTPIWDWFNIYNIKNKRLWYIDFSCPFIDDYFQFKNFDEKMTLAAIDLYYKNAYQHKKTSWSSINKRDAHYDMITKHYKTYNNWELTFKQYEEKNERNKNWNEGIKVFKNKNDSDDFCAIMPYAFSKRDDMSIKDAFIEIVSIITGGKLCIGKHYYQLIEEIGYDLNLFDKEKNIERFI